MRPYLFLSFNKPSPGGERELWQIGLGRLLQERGETVLVMSTNAVVLKLARDHGLPTRQVGWLAAHNVFVYFWWLVKFRLGKLTSETGHIRGRREERPVIVCWSHLDQVLATLPARLFGMSVLWGVVEKPYGWWQWLQARLATLFAPSRALSHETYGKLKCQTAVVTPLIDPSGIRLQPWRFRETIPEWTIAVVNDLTRPWQTSLVLQALPELLELVPLARVVVIGAGPERQHLLWLAKTLGVDGRVSWVTPLPDGAPWFPRAQAIVVARVDESAFSWTVARAQLAGIPIVASNTGVHQEYITSEETGWLFQPSDFDSLTQALVQVANRPERAIEIVARAKIEATKRHTSERVWQQWRRLVA